MPAPAKPATPTTLDLLLRQFPGRLFVSVPEASRLFGQAPKTSRNQIAAGTFPIKTVKVGSFHRVVFLVDLAAYLDSLIDQPRRGPGRPRSSREGV